ncbi:SDR family NAD(P)-dependent oxidoreductase [Kerstersia sp.]|uniref:SDR family NAD(P)-dependent oxidoreductase n=1 Tax=Kerstersia sp. TaxID=1930783 RepID=UPI003F8E66AF
MQIMIVGASQGLGRALAEGLCAAGDTLIGVSRQAPEALRVPEGVACQWVEADLTAPAAAAAKIARAAPASLDVLIYNLGLWEVKAFTADYFFTQDTDESLARLVDVNVTAALLVIKHLLPRLLVSPRPRLILTGSTSALRQCGRPEVAFGATKSALNGLGDALREGFREAKLGVTTLQLGYLNTTDDLAVPAAQAAWRGEGKLVPVHDVVAMVRTILSLSDASFVRELVMPAILDERF